MSELKKISLKDKIISEMIVDYSNSLEKNFDLAKKFIRITKDGKVDVLNKDKLSGIDKIFLYLLGKLYAKEAGFSLTDDASNEEIMNELGIPKGSMLPWTKELRDLKKIKTITRENLSHHHVLLNLIEKTLKEIENKMNKRLRGL